ncbi:hypothetical protein A6U88_03765 [Agrobacterium sp. B131/95]|nr:hypothetical protein A6U88_03765 [Agrobacterium sp. B131/95]
MLETCPVCNDQLTFAQTRGIYFCHACGDPNDVERDRVDLRDFPQSQVELESFENIEFACSLIDPELEHGREVVRSLHTDLRILQRGQVFESIVLIARLLDGLANKTPGASVSPASLHEATSGVRSWPQGGIEIGERVKGVWRNRTLQHSRTFLHPISREVAAFDAFFGMDFPKVLRNQLRAGLQPIERQVSKEVSERTARYRRA